MPDLFLSHFEFPDREKETTFHFKLKETCYDTLYPMGILSKNSLQMLDFEPITILYGGNGSGKTTALNVIAEKIKAKRDTLYNRSNFFEDYVKMCKVEERMEGYDSRIITSDDVFDYMLNIRALNEEVDQTREEIGKEYFDVRDRSFRLESLDDYEELKKINFARRKTKSKFVRNQIIDNVREQSNGESAYMYFTNTIKENGLYLLDEPENSLSPERQLELRHFLTDCTRFFGCQVIIATHSPFILSMKGAKIYDLDEEPVDVKRWTELPNVRAYYDFFQEHKGEF